MSGEADLLCIASVFPRGNVEVISIYVVTKRTNDSVHNVLLYNKQYLLRNVSLGTVEITALISNAFFGRRCETMAI